MMKFTHILSIFILFGLSNTIYAQNTSNLFGHVTSDEIKMKSYKKDLKAEAVALYDIGKSYFIKTDNGFELYFERRTKIKILDNPGVEYATVEIPYYHEGRNIEIVDEIEANSYNVVDGRTVRNKLDLKTVYEEKINERWSLKKFAIPNVKKGSIIEYKYRVITPFMFNLIDWEFQKRIPVIHSEYRVDMIPFYEYTYILQGKAKFDSHKSRIEDDIDREFSGIYYNDVIHTFIMNDVPAFREESYITSINDYIMKMDFQLAKINHPGGSVEKIMTTWADINEALLKNKNFGKYIKKCEALSKDKSSDLDLVNDNKLEIINSVVKYLKLNYKWDKTTSKYPTKTSKEFELEKIGNSANINLFLNAFLRTNGIESYPVLLSTRDHGKVHKGYPFYHFFNNVIVVAYVDGKSYLLDATNQLCPSTLIPSNNLNGEGLIVKSKSKNWINIDNSLNSNINYKFNLTIKPGEGSVNHKIKITSDNYDALMFRERYGKDISEITDKMFDEDSEDIKVVKLNFDKIEEPYVIIGEFSKLFEEINNHIFITPFYNKPISDNPLTQMYRSYPIDMVYQKSRNFTCEFEIPEGYTVKKIPDNLNVDNGLVYISLEHKKEDNEYSVVGNYTFKKSVYRPSDYTQLKGYLDLIIREFNKKITLTSIE